MVESKVYVRGGVNLKRGQWPIGRGRPFIKARLSMTPLDRTINFL